jgi:hypothetical protein
MYFNSTTDAILGNGTNHTMSFYTNNGERISITSAGNVGIGTTSPGYLLNTYASTTSLSIQQVIQNNNAGAGTAALGFSVSSIGGGEGLVVKGGIGFQRNASYGGGFMAFYNNNSGAAGDFTTADEKMRIDNSGRLLVGTTSDVVGNNPVFIVNGTGFGNGSEFRWTGTASFYNIMVANGNGFLGGINTSGSTTSFNNLSDYRVKENIKPMLNALEKVALLKPCTFTYKIDGKDGQGFIAHELQAVVPDAVTGEKDAVDANGNPKYQGVDTSFLVATLTAAIQEQQALIESLTTRLTALENR